MYCHCEFESADKKKTCKKAKTNNNIKKMRNLVLT